ncbi:4-hydroxyacetophenone monooxygenase [Rhizoctonia solani]|uniref:L-ornithine N(5)-monooxygenase [NAD(P)H] n=1 Tax=Rhizoctonia solani TaxID=456999 RepID=A0A0K6G2W6_9AGAM|nr:4-hydroxyacetophenone monooxygenase [Rhizoctonia solani]
MSINIAIIGAGIGGITAAISLQNTLGVYDYTIYELASEIGGTWQQNNYPGCACDVAGHWYSLSTEPNPNWSHPFAPREEIHQYWKGLVAKHRVEPHIKFNTELLSAEWNEKERHYTLRLRNAITHQVTQVTTKIVISAVGLFRHPRWPEVPGRETFKGDLLHAQMWDHSISLSGKRVALIGNGCAGSQILPVISQDSSTMVTNFCRTPSWYIPRDSKPVPKWVKWCFKYVPYALRSKRYLHVGQSEFFYQYFRLTPLAARLRKNLEKSMIDYIKNKAPAQYHQYLIPKYDIGCKRVVLDPGYLESLNRSNVEMEWDPITMITPNGIETQSGHRHQFDVIAFATGFDIASSMALDVTGVNGQRLQEYYDREGGPTGYMGTTIPGFPNWFTILGPNTATGHSSVIFAEELQVR